MHFLGLFLRHIIVMVELISHQPIKRKKKNQNTNTEAKPPTKTRVCQSYAPTHQNIYSQSTRKHPKKKLKIKKKNFKTVSPTISASS